MKTYFINEAFEKAINDYVNSKDKKESILYNSFLVVVIRLLICIYGELDIINPYKIKNEDAFDINLMKYGAPKELVNSLKKLVNDYYEIEKRNIKIIKRENNPNFVEIQKKIIDLFNIKRLKYGVDEKEIKEFFDLLYTPGTSNVLRLSYNYLCAPDVYEIAEYYKTKMEEKPNDSDDGKKDLLGFDVYKLFNVSIADLSKLDNNDIDKLNKHIYKAFDIKENAINKDYLLEEKVREFKIERNPITTGNGYVDILLIMSIIITVVMVVIIFGTLVF